MEELKLNDTQGEQIWVPCGKCSGKTLHRVLFSADNYYEEDVGFWTLDSYQIIQCQGCTEISFRYYVNDAMSDYRGEKGTVEEIYPSRVAGRPVLHRACFLPQNVSHIYNETHKALCSNQPILAGIGIRALLEAVCKEKLARGKDLEQKIDNLLEAGILTKSGAEILHGLRILGNVSAHEVKPQPETTLGVAMDVIEHLLSDVYIIPKQSEMLPKRNKTGE
jgi:hypothetical protein